MRITRPDPGARARAWLIESCLRGETPTEALATEDREYVIHRLWKRGWTDAEIATATLQSTYTTARIRSRLGLAPNRTVREVA